MHSAPHAQPDGVRTEDKWMPRVRRPASGACRAVRPAAAELACGPRLLWGMMPRSARGDGHGQPDWRARPTTQGGQGAAQGGAGRPAAVRYRPQHAACRLPPAAARRPPATVKPCGPALPACRRDGTAWAGNSWLPRAVGTAQRLGPGSVEMRPEIRAVGVASPAGRQCMHVTCAHEGGVRHQC